MTSSKSKEPRASSVVYIDNLSLQRISILLFLVKELRLLVLAAPQKGLLLVA